MINYFHGTNLRFFDLQFSKKSKDDMAGRNDKNTKVILPNNGVASSNGSKEACLLKPGDYVVAKVYNSVVRSEFVGRAFVYMLNVSWRKPWICYLFDSQANEKKKCIACLLNMWLFFFFLFLQIKSCSSQVLHGEPLYISSIQDYHGSYPSHHGNEPQTVVMGI